MLSRSIVPLCLGDFIYKWQKLMVLLPQSTRDPVPLYGCTVLISLCSYWLTFKLCSILKIVSNAYGELFKDKNFTFDLLIRHLSSVHSVPGTTPFLWHHQLEEQTLSINLRKDNRIFLLTVHHIITFIMRPIISGKPALWRYCIRYFISIFGVIFYPEICN